TASSSPSLVSSLPSPASPSAISINSLPKPRPLSQLPPGSNEAFWNDLENPEEFRLDFPEELS
ncbi:hypothetical protein HID58_044036, partial [Brassica napus]